MPRWIACLAASVLLAACAGRRMTEAPPTAAPLLLEGARLIIGDGSVVEDGAILVTGSKISRVGPAGEVGAPAGATRVDLTGKTVIPALIDAHAHLGFEGFTSWAGENYTRENLVDHLERYAYYGFGAVFSAGTDPVDLAREIRQAQEAGRVAGARLLFAVGMAPPGAGPNPQMLRAVSVLDPGIVRAAGSESQARAAVREVAAQRIPFIKIWVDDRNGGQPKLSPPVYRALIEEATRHGIRVFAHQQTADDTKELIRAGAAGFLHGRIGSTTDDELVSMLKRSGAFLVPNIGLGERGRYRAFDDPFLRATLAPAVLRRMRETYVERPAAPPESERELRAAFGRLMDGEVEIVLGTDAGALPDHFFGYAGHVELEIYTRLGMTPMQALVAATSRPARHLGLTDMGTLAPGKSADFVVLDANPLDDIRNTRRISAVYLRGEPVERETLARRFRNER